MLMQGIVSMPQEQWRYLTCLTMMYLQRCWRLWTLLNLETGCSNWTRIGPKTWRMKMCQELKLKINMGNWLSTHWSPVQKEQVSAGSRMLHSIFNEVNNSVALELRKTSKAEVTWTSYMLTSDICNLKEMVYPRLFERKGWVTLKFPTLVVFYSDMSNKPIQFEGKAANCPG